MLAAFVCSLHKLHEVNVQRSLVFNTLLLKGKLYVYEAALDYMQFQSSWQSHL
jgi:hypothetical protein